MTGALSSLLLLDSPLGDDRQLYQSGTLHAVAMTARERISAPYEIDVEAVSAEQAIDPDRLLYRSVGLTVRRKDGIDRRFHGIVRRFTSVGIERRGRWVYRLEIVPRLWFLAQSVDCRIFQHKSAKDILSEIFREHDITDVEFRIFGSDEVRPYTTQFDESYLQFVQRIMQESGLYYFFEFEQANHKLVITNRNQSFRQQSGPLHRVVGQGDNVDIFNEWSESLATTTGAVQIQDYDPEKPRRLVDGQQRTRLETAGAVKRNVYRWPAMTVDRNVADKRAQYRQEAAEAAAALCRGHGFDPRLSAGLRFTLEKDPIDREADVDFVVQSVTHRASDETWLGGTAPPTFECEFACFRQSVTWRDELTIPRPVMAGIFSGIVLGEAGQEIHADSLARIKVQPLFEHRKETTAAGAIFIRVLHAWAGNRWGWQHLPRVGTEVGISFMNGDPDNPVVVGCFYHQDDPPVFPVPGEQTKQGFRSRSTVKGGTKDFNELSFDDAKDNELLYLHAQKDQTTEVENDQLTVVDRDRSVVVKRDKTITIGRDGKILSQRGDISITANFGTITLRSGPSQIEISEGGIVIKGPLIRIN
ncbi:type VI secretion system secreted protein VgrG [Methylobacterium sp. OAE515]|uniref:type VI secretion system Vgr family protein n=1 Tax=Methylobacterium sp. OAE515 TaxID=2817895 RepID=UPI00178A8988